MRVKVFGIVCLKGTIMDNEMKDISSSITGKFLNLFNSLMCPSSLSVRVKELIAIGIATTNTCDLCIRMHIDKCIKAGGTPTEIMDAAGVGVVMGGGPACVNVKKIADILDKNMKKNMNNADRKLADPNCPYRDGGR